MPTYQGHVQRVTDGDTVVVRFDAGGARSVRLYGIDCPETSQPYGPAATRAAQNLVSGERVDVHVLDEDHYGRLVGRVQTEDCDLGRTLTAQGLAWHDHRHAGGADLIARRERDARQHERGLWSQADPVPPWQWRNGSSQRRAKQTLRGLGWAFLGFVGTILFFALLVALAA